LTVPLATYTGWGLRSGVWANDGCEASGQYIPFKATKAERLAAKDPRPSVEERYQSFHDYRGQVIRAVDELVRHRFLICDDTVDMVNRLLQAGLAAGVPAVQAGESATSPDPVPACVGHIRFGHHSHGDGDHDGDDHGRD